MFYTLSPLELSTRTMIFGFWSQYTTTPKSNMGYNILFEVFCSTVEIIAGVKESTALQCCYYIDDPGNQEGPKPV